MTVLDTGIALVVFGTPVLAILLTLIVSLIEAFYLDRFVSKFSKTFKITLFVNSVSTVSGFIIILWFSVADIFELIGRFTGLSFKPGDGLKGYGGRLLLLILFYALTLLIEIPLF